MLASDVEYRLHFLLQEAKKFMVHGKRSTLMPEDVEHAMEALNVEVGVLHILHLPSSLTNLLSQSSFLLNHYLRPPFMLSQSPLGKLEHLSSCTTS